MKNISTQQTTKTSKQDIDSQQERQLMILNETNITDNRKSRDKKSVIKGIANKNTNEKVTSFQEIKANLVRGNLSQSYVASPPVLSRDTSIV